MGDHYAKFSSRVVEWSGGVQLRDETTVAWELTNENVWQANDYCETKRETTGRDFRDALDNARRELAALEARAAMSGSSQGSSDL
jgi:hypothetical protein